MSSPESSALPPPQPRNTYICRRAPGPIVIDGNIDKAVWQAAVWTDDFVDIEGDLKPLPRHRTRVKMLWDDECFYVAAEMDEPHVWGTLTVRDSVIFHDNDFEVFLNPTRDTLNYYELEINALNTVWDLLLPKPYRQGGKAVDAFDFVGLRHAVRIRGTLNDPRDVDEGWDVEIAFPWASFTEHVGPPEAGTPPRAGEEWAINFSRVEWDTEVVGEKYKKVEGRREHNWVWSPMGLIDMHLPERWGVVRFER